MRPIGLGHAHNKRCNGPLTTLEQINIDRNLSSHAQRIVNSNVPRRRSCRARSEKSVGSRLALAQAHTAR
jgi:hypothetical protein